MTERERISLETIIDLIGDKVGEQYEWFLIGFEAQGVLDDRIKIDDANEKNYHENLEYYDVSWEFIKKVSKTLHAVVTFDLVAMKNKEDFLNQRNQLIIEGGSWEDFVCDFEFYIYDGEIWEIKGSDVFLVNRMKKIFSTLPVLLW